MATGVPVSAWASRQDASWRAASRAAGQHGTGPREAKAPMMGKPGAVNTLKGAEVVTDMPKQVAKPVA